MNPGVARFLRVLQLFQDVRSSPIISRVTDLSAHLGVKNGIIENDGRLDLSTSSTSFNIGARMIVLVTEKIRRRHVPTRVCDLDHRFSSAPRARAMRCSSINFSKPATSTVSPRSRAISSVRSSGNPCSS